MNLRQLESFVYVAKLKSFSKAAEQLYLTQPTISAHISQLERELGTSLFSRSTKNVALTDSGQKIFAYAEEILNIINTIMTEFGSKTKKQTSIVVAASTTPFQYIVPSVLSKHKETYGNCSFKLIESNSESVMECIRDRDADIGFVGSVPDEEFFDSIPIYSDVLLLVTPNTPHFRDLKINNAPLTELLKEPIILREVGSGTRTCTEEFFKSSGISISDLNVITTIDNVEALRNACVRGLGISIMSALSVKNEVKNGTLLSFPFQDGKLTRTFYMIWNKTKHPSKIIKQFTSIIDQI